MNIEYINKYNNNNICDEDDEILTHQAHSINVQIDLPY